MLLRDSLLLAVCTARLTKAVKLRRLHLVPMKGCKTKKSDPLLEEVNCGDFTVTIYFANLHHACSGLSVDAAISQ